MFSQKSHPALYEFPSRFPVRQWAVLTALSFLTALLPIARSGVNIVTATYQNGAHSFFQGKIPYGVVFANSDRFDYSPCFALFYGAFAYLPSQSQALAWLLLNVALFWAGLLHWFKFRPGQSGLFWFGFAVVSAELNISVLYQQVNALLIGLSLMGLAWLRDGHSVRAGICLAIITDLKPLPAVFSFSLLARPNRKLVTGFAIGSLLALTLPILAVGLEQNLALHARWVMSLVDSAQMVRPGQLDVGRVWAVFGWGAWGQILRVSIFVVTLLLLAGGRRAQLNDDPLWFAIGALGLLLVLSRSESPTYVFMAPAYLALARSLLLERPNPARGPKIGLLVICSFFITLGFTDLWPAAKWNHWRLVPQFKTLGGLGLWILAMTQFLSALKIPWRASVLSRKASFR